eukprot:jgi/Phyca11/18434/fgenesh1_pg.PHYCAscaffold_36_\
MPPNASKEWLRACLELWGAVQHVVEGSTGLFNEHDEEEAVATDSVANHTAHVVFKSPQANPLENKYRRNRPGLSVMKELEDRYMASFDEMEEEDKRRRDELKDQVDDDGFQTVVNTKKRGIVQAEGAGQAGQETLRGRFEEDRQLVQKVKKASKFRPESTWCFV